jgi:hypothetical protein
MFLLSRAYHELKRAQREENYPTFPVALTFFVAVAGLTYLILYLTH